LAFISVTNYMVSALNNLKRIYMQLFLHCNCFWQYGTAMLSDYFRKNI